ncbi:hypothetical protein BRE01_17970 [Brevibacillus reuszeri]|uniref:B30.2/SPRY domain-containing protein n=1 Tax=Brevibacillus reuszeri TaxID=54915 RepID=A0A0K9Z1H9_9BACL|nr:SPRY domain-containing protein [Brevibacillus reuszeri]KNB74320.1 hypothetical protein ADS79_01020 [Brevibacillus reuszeri]MED1856216.1 hypothetical protein [Brevibacillus reuszeri]GED68095.1 hypothetical protein BRE01_17970 [Brevibacillus reuszeri]
MAITTNKVVAFYKGAGTNTTWKDQSGNNRDGEISVTYLPVPFKKSFKTDVLTMPNATYANVKIARTGSMDCSISALVKYDVATSSNNLGIFDSGRMTVNLLGTGEINVLFSDNTTKKKSTKSIPVGIWVHLFIDQAARKIYINGQDVTTDLSTSWSLSAFADSYIGRGYYATAPMSYAYFKLLDGTAPYSIADIRDEADEAKKTIVGLKTDFKNMAIGDAVLLKYSGVSGYVGTITTVADLIPPSVIPPASAVTTSGCFYAYMVGNAREGELILASDRNVQTSITHDTLNSYGIASGNGLPITIGTALDSMVSVGGGGYCTQNTVTVVNAGGARTELGISSGKYYWEVSVISKGLMLTGIASAGVPMSNPVSSYVRSVGMNATKYDGANTPYGEAYNDGDVIGVALDMNAGTIEFYKNGIAQGVAFTDLKTFGTVYPIIFNGSSSVTLKAKINFGAENFRYDIPTGYGRLAQLSLYDIAMRLPTGGVSATETADSEWDKYILNSTMGGALIDAGDNSVWNWSGIYSWTSTVALSAAGNRSVRGHTSASGYASYASSSATLANSGFRPFFIVSESKRIRFLVVDGTEVKTFQRGSWESVGTEPITDVIASSFGMTDVASFLPHLKKLENRSNIRIIVIKEIQGKTSASMEGVPKPKVVKMKNDISLLHSSNIDSIMLVGSRSGSGVVKVAISTDGGEVWETNRGTGWETVDTTSLTDFKSRGMTIEEFNLVKDWLAKVGSRNILRLAFYLEQQTSADTAFVDTLSMQLDLKGSWDVATQGVDYKYGYNSNTNLRVLLMSNGDFKINFGGGGGSTITEVDGGTF